MPDLPQPTQPSWSSYRFYSRGDLEESVIKKRDNGQHAYFERHPSTLAFQLPSEADVPLAARYSLLPRRRAVLAGKPLTSIPHGVISTPPAPVINGNGPDFVWLRCDSLEIKIVAISTKPHYLHWRDPGGGSSTDLQRASEELEAYRLWFADPVNRAAVLRLYRIHESVAAGRELTVLTLLVMGADADAARAANAVARTSSIQQEYFKSYYRLDPDPEFSDLVTLRLSDNGYEVTHVPATFTLNWSSGPSLVHLPGLEESIASSASMSPERRSHLLARLPEWRHRMDQFRQLQNDGDWD